MVMSKINVNNKSHTHIHTHTPPMLKCASQYRHPPCAIACIKICMHIKNPKHWQPCLYHCLDPQKYCTHWYAYVALLLQLLQAYPGKSWISCKGITKVWQYISSTHLLRNWYKDGGAILLWIYVQPRLQNCFLHRWDVLHKNTSSIILPMSKESNKKKLGSVA